MVLKHYGKNRYGHNARGAEQVNFTELKLNHFLKHQRSGQMRLKWSGLMIFFGFLIVSCATETGPRFADLRANKQQQIAQDLENNGSAYIIHYIPQRAVLFDPKDDGNTLLVSGRWFKPADNETVWVEILRQNTKATDSIFDPILGKTTGFQEVIGPDEQVFGYLIHEKMDLVTLKIIDRNTMRIFYAPQRTEGP
jgi:hypothetical protein